MDSEFKGKILNTLGRGSEKEEDGGRENNSNMK